MQPPILTRLLSEDYPGAPSWFSNKLLVVLNRFMEQTTAVLGNITFGDNIQSSTFSTSFTLLPNYPGGLGGDFETISFAWRGSALPQACLVTKISLADGTPFLSVIGVPNWNFANGSINVTYIAGLGLAGTKYNVTLLAF